MKKILAVLCALVIMFSFVACSIGECDNCGDFGRTKEISLFGQSAELCKDCAGPLW